MLELDGVLESLKTDPLFFSWYLVVERILTHPEFQKRKLMKHHEKDSVFDHCVKVSFMAYKIACHHQVSSRNCAIAGLLHDFYTAAWQYSPSLEMLDACYRAPFLPGYKKPSLFQKHGFIHPKIALENAYHYFPEYMNARVANAILMHMFPLSICTKYRFPKCKEAWVVTYADKRVTLQDFPHIKEIPKYMGFVKKKGPVEKS